MKKYKWLLSILVSFTFFLNTNAWSSWSSTMEKYISKQASQQKGFFCIQGKITPQKNVFPREPLQEAYIVLSVMYPETHPCTLGAHYVVKREDHRDLFFKLHLRLKDPSRRTKKIPASLLRRIKAEAHEVTKKDIELHTLKTNIINEFTDLSDQVLYVEKEELSDRKIILSEGYSSRCRSVADAMEFKISSDIQNDQLNLSLSIADAYAVKKDIVTFYYSAEIKSNGSNSKIYLSNKKIEGTNKFKKQVKKNEGAYLYMGWSLMSDFSPLSHYGTNNSLFLEKKLDGGTFLSELLSILSQNKMLDGKTVEVFKSQLINNSDIDITKKYVGFTEIDNEKYDIFKHSFKTNYFGNDPRVKQFLKQNIMMNQETYIFVHSKSGLPIVFYTDKISKPTMYTQMRCSLYQDDTLISSYSSPGKIEFEGEQTLKKEKKEKPKKLVNTKQNDSKNSTGDEDIVTKIEKLNNLYKSGVLTKEEFKKAKEKLLN